MPEEKRNLKENLTQGEKLAENLRKTLLVYRVPAVFATLSIIFLLIAAVMLFKGLFREEDAVFLSGESTQSASLKKIKVDVEGAVVSPGVYEFIDGSRIEDALSSAGGLSKNADLVWIAKNLNRAAKLADGGKLYIPEKNNKEVRSQNSEVSKIDNTSNNLLGVTEGLVNINTASYKELVDLNGIGDVTANKIISGRPFQSVEELKTRKIVNSGMYEKIKNLITVY